MADSDVKMEVKPEFKVDPGDSPLAMDDVEQYVDDVGDLSIPDGGQAWLINVPKALWDAWNDMYRNAAVGEEIAVGKLFVHDLAAADQASKQKIQIRMSDPVKRIHTHLAGEYDLELKTNGYNNTTIFSEKDHPGHRGQAFAPGRTVHSTRPSGIPPKADRYARQRRPGGYRTAIPKKAALAPIIHHEAVATPVLADTYADLAQAFRAEADKTARVEFDRDQYRRIQPGALHHQPLFQFGSYSSKPGAKGNKKKVQRDKAVRIERTLLLDQLQKLFTEYSYWKLGGLKSRLNQPENYIKQTLEEIAILVKQGDFANTYKLKPEYENLARMHAAGSLKQEVAPEDDDGNTDGTGYEMDEEDDFEDVMDVKSDH